MELTDRDPSLILAGLFELTITYLEDDEKRERCKVLVRKLGGDPDAMFFTQLRGTRRWARWIRPPLARMCSSRFHLQGRCARIRSINQPLRPTRENREPHGGRNG